MSKVAVVTGAGTGVGRAVVIALARERWDVVLVARTEAHLNETIRLVGSGRGESRLVACPGDIADETFAPRLAERVQRELGDVDVLVNNAGTNIPRRALE